MKRYLMALCLTLTVAGSAAIAAEDNTSFPLCSNWQLHSSHQRSSLVLGWLLGVEAADTKTGDEIMSKLWPRGHRVGSMVIEINVECDKPYNRDEQVKTIVLRIVRRLNGEVG